MLNLLVLWGWKFISCWWWIVIRWSTVIFCIWDILKYVKYRNQTEMHINLIQCLWVGDLQEFGIPRSGAWSKSKLLGEKGFLHSNSYSNFFLYLLLLVTFYGRPQHINWLNKSPHQQVSISVNHILLRVAAGMVASGLFPSPFSSESEQSIHLRVVIKVQDSWWALWHHRGCQKVIVSY